MQRNERRELNYLFYGKWKIGFLARQSDTAARCGDGFHKRSSLTYVNTPYGPIVAAFLGRTWENMKTWINTSIIIS